MTSFSRSRYTEFYKNKTEKRIIFSRREKSEHTSLDLLSDPLKVDSDSQDLMTDSYKVYR